MTVSRANRNEKTPPKLIFKPFVKDTSPIPRSKSMVKLGLFGFVLPAD